MVGIPSFVHYTSTQEILKFIANLSGAHVEEVFQGIARMPQISSVVLDRILGLSSDMFEDFRDALLLSREDKPPITRLPNRSANL
jgi:hypothetical protein